MTAPRRHRDEPRRPPTIAPQPVPPGRYTRRFELGLVGLLVTFAAWALLRIGAAWLNGGQG